MKRLTVIVVFVVTGFVLFTELADGNKETIIQSSEQVTGADSVLLKTGTSNRAMPQGNPLVIISK
jgi:hypothetical protein